MSLRNLQRLTGERGQPSHPKAKPKPKRQPMSLGQFHQKTGGASDSWRDRGGWDQPTGSDEIYVPRAKRAPKAKAAPARQQVPDVADWNAKPVATNSAWNSGAPQAATDALWDAPVPAPAVRQNYTKFNSLNCF